MKDKAFRLVNSIPVFIMLITGFMLVCNMAEVSIDLRLSLCGLGIILGSFLFTCLFQSRHKALRIILRIIFALLTLAFVGYLFKDVIYDVYTYLSTGEVAGIREILTMLLAILMAMRWELYLFEIILGSFVLVTHILSGLIFRKQWYPAVIFACIICCFIAGIYIGYGTGDLILCMPVFFCILFILFCRNLYIKKNGDIPAQALAALLLAAAFGVAFLLYPKFETVENPPVMRLDILDPIMNEAFGYEKEAYDRVIKDKKIGAINNKAFDSKDDQVLFTYSGDVKVKRFIAYDFDYYDPEAKAFIIADKEYMELEVPREKHNVNATITPYYSEALAGEEGLPVYDLIPDFKYINVRSYRKDSVLMIPHSMYFLIDESLYPSVAYEDKVIVLDNTGLPFTPMYNEYTYAVDESNIYKKLTPQMVYEYDRWGNIASSKITWLNGRYYPYFEAEYLDVPEEMTEGLEIFVEKYGLSRRDDPVKIAKRVEEIFNSEYVYTNKPAELRKGQDPVLYFLNVSHQGYSRHFAAAKTLVYRYLGIPARFVVGYYTEKKEVSLKDELKGLQFSDVPDEKGIVVRSSDEFAWCDILINRNWTASDDLRIFDLSNNLQVIEIKGSITDAMEEADDLPPPPPPEDDGSDQQGPNGSEPPGQSEKPGGDSGIVTGPNGDISNANEDPASDYSQLCIVFRSDQRNIDRFRQYAYGDFDPAASSFKYDTDLYDFPDIDSRSLFVNYDPGYLDSTVTVNSYVLTNSLFTPCSSTIYAEGVYAYYDRALLFGNMAKAYTVLYHTPDGSKGYESEEYDEFVNDKYLRVPDSMVDPLRNFLISRGIDPDSPDKRGIIENIKWIFQNEFYYSRYSIPELPGGENAVLYFLNSSKTGKCIHYASSATLLFRVCGIPARYVTGYTVHEYDEEGFGYCYAVDAHAWPEVYLSGQGWRCEEVTLGTEIEAPPEIFPEEMTEEFVTPEEMDVPVVDFEEAEIEELEKHQTPTQQDPEGNKIDKRSTFQKILQSAAFKAISILLAVCVCAAVLTVLLKKLYLKIRIKLSRNSRINLSARPIEKEDALTEESYEMLEKLRYSCHEATEEDEALITGNYDELIKSLKARRKYLRILGIRISLFLKTVGESVRKK
ncbi:MAG: hypothetical protein IJI56_01215 [Firmicutes bacterium]|nr:hypothetical protein [Bacillota bacterium]